MDRPPPAPPSFLPTPQALLEYYTNIPSKAKAKLNLPMNETIHFSFLEMIFVRIENTLSLCLIIASKNWMMFQRDYILLYMKGRMMK